MPSYLVSTVTTPVARKARREEMALVEKPGRMRVTLPGGSRGELVSPCLDTILGGVVRWSCVIWCGKVWWCGVVVWCGGVVQWCGRMWWLVWCCGIVGGDEWLVVCTHLSRHGDAPHRRARLQLTLPSLPSTSTAVLQCPTWGISYISYRWYRSCRSYMPYRHYMLYMSYMPYMSYML